MFRKISNDVKIAAINLYERALLPLEDILDCCGFSRRTFFRILHLWRTTGSIEKPSHRLRGRPKLLAPDDVEYLLRLVRHRPDWFLDELVDLLDENRFISIHFSTICRELSRAGYSLKKLKKIAAERNEDKRAAFVYHMAQYTPDQLGFIDETSKDDQIPGRRKGRARKGRRAIRKQVFVRGHRLSGTGLLTVDGMVAATVVEGSMTAKTFYEFLQDNVLPLCSPFPGPLSVLIMDNCRIHHSADVRELVEAYGVRLEFLPPYSPDLNPIEEAFSQIKSFIRHNCDVFLSAVGPSIMYDFLQALTIVSAENAQAYIMHASY